ncbi:MAG TPA: hydrogen peroxide-dependent heme synthase [Longimicrobiaceae bacterium]|nr:hydrogen peroxide-dependent heme synthase [Longimicrobiaceae bacterium]
MAALPPATLEGWYTLHQAFSLDWHALRALGASERGAAATEFERLLRDIARPERGGWSASFQLIGGGADLMLLHFRTTLEELGEVELLVKKSRLGAYLRVEYDYISVTEAGLYHATAQMSKEAEPGSDAFRAGLQERSDAEAASPHVHKRLYPEIPEGMRYLSFYPMSKRRSHPENWYTLPVEERSRLMRDHGMTGRRFAGKIFQVINGSVGLDDWEWGVTLFARDPLEFKHIVTEMRYDEASALYGEFGRFFTGIRRDPQEWPALLAATDESGA